MSGDRFSVAAIVCVVIVLLVSLVALYAYNESLNEYQLSMRRKLIMLEIDIEQLENQVYQLNGDIEDRLYILEKSATKRR